MKRALSLLLTLAMVMSLFTTAAFAAGDGSGDSEANAIVNAGLTATVQSGKPATILTNGQTTLSGGTMAGAELYWKSSDDTVATVTSAGVVEGKKAGEVTFTRYAKVKGDGDRYTYYTAGSTATVTVEADKKADYALTTVSGVATAYNLPVGGTLDASAIMKLYKGTTEASGVTYTFTSSNTAVAKVSGSTVTAVGAGTAYISCTASYKGCTYEATAATITVKTLDLSKTIVNGSKQSYTASALASEIQSKIYAVTGKTVTVSAIDLTTISPAYGISYTKTIGSTTTAAGNGDDLTISNNDYLTVTTTAGSIGSSVVAYTVTTNNGTYTGKITFTSDYADTIDVTQYAPFTKEEFKVDAMGVVSLLATGTPASYASSSVVSATAMSVTPQTTSWTKTYTGYVSATNPVAYKINVTFVPSDYDIISYVEDNVSPFDFEVFGEFAEVVCAEQDSYAAVSAEYVQFPTVSSSKWTLKKGGTAIKSTDKFTASTLDAVILDVTTAGYYDIPFNVYYNYRTVGSSTWTTTATVSYQGLIRVYAALDGDIKYEVAYGETVKFNSADFTRLYKKLAGNSYTMSSMVVDELPLYGALYRDGKISNSYLVDAKDVFYVTPTSANDSYDLNGLTYWASRSYTDEYSVFIPVTMYGTGGYETAVVEIKINGGMPFVDIAKGSTFYEYIRYVYNHGIMGGKSPTNFDAKSSITRIQLVTTLYRMAGSPTYYNGTTLTFTDTRNLSAEFTNALKWATANGIVNGYGTKFNPHSPVTRQAMVTILYRYAKDCGYDVGVLYNNHLGSYTDGGKVSTSMVTAMNWAVDYGLISGNGSKLNPGGSTTRGAAAKILANFHASFIG